MEEKRFHREDYPLDILAEFGLTEQMIYDLPDFVHEVLEMGGMSPLLPIEVEQPFGVTRGYAKFCLIETEEGIEVLFSPKLKQSNLDVFTKMQQDALLAGKVIVADIDDTVITDEGVEEEQRIKAFVQFDKDTNGVIYSPTQVIGRNLKAISNEFDLTGNDLQKFWNGDLVTVNDTNEQGEKESVTIGVDLTIDKGVLVVPGTAAHWERLVRRPMPHYAFGSDGCWVNNGGKLIYVPEESFTKDILDELSRLAKKNGVSYNPSEEETVEREQANEESIVDDEQRQLAR